MNGRLAGQRCVITGAASGIGAATARLFAAEGARVCVADLRREAGEAVAASLDGAIFAAADVSREADVEAAVAAAVAAFGGLDCMINNAGVTGATGSIVDLENDAWRATLDVLLSGPFYGIKHAARAMRPRRQGCILNVASVAGLVAGLGPHAYTAAKHGVIGLTRSVAAELAADGIRVNAIAPGAVATALSARSRGQDMAAAEANARAKSPIGEPVSADDIAGALLYLASAEGRHVTGQVISIDGGLTASHPPRPGLYAAGMRFFGADA